MKNIKDIKTKFTKIVNELDQVASDLSVEDENESNEIIIIKAELMTDIDVAMFRISKARDNFDSLLLRMWEDV